MVGINLKRNNMKIIIIKSPQRNIDVLEKELVGCDFSIIDDPNTMGKDKFYIRMNQAFQICLESKHDKFLIIHDDCINVDLRACEKLMDKDSLLTISPHTDNRRGQWSGNKDGLEVCRLGKYSIVDIDFSDGMLLTNRKTLEAIGSIQNMSEDWRKRHASSGVGFQITTKARSKGVKMYGTIPSLLFHGNQESVMHPYERKLNPLISDMGKKVIVGIATMKGREESLKQAIKSLQNQVDEILIYDNEVMPNRADNGKFFPLRLYKEPIYFFSCDDDLIYPPDYAITMIDAIERNKCIVGHHGRILKGANVSYYSGHDSIRFNQRNEREIELDVIGTGVCAFDTEYFNPIELCDHKELRMVDILFSLEAKRSGKKMLSLKHGANWIKQADLKGGFTICDTEIKEESRQIKYANEIWQLKNFK